MVSKNKYYSLKKGAINQDIDSLDIASSLKNGLIKVNNELYNYALKLNTNVINSKVSFYYIFSDLKYGEKKKITDMIKRMFFDYDLCRGTSKKIDVSDDSPVYVLEHIEENDFWEVDFTYHNRPNHYNYFLADIKKACRDLIKCIFISCKEELIIDSKEEIEKESNDYKNQKYYCDYIFRVEDKENIYKEMQKYLVDSGYECDFNPDDISSINEYRDNELYIENALIKNNIMKDNNHLSFKDLSDKTNTKVFIKINDMIGLKNVKEEIKNMEYLLKFYKDINKTNEGFLNVIFKGNPGTGKTTVARNYADILYKLGYIKNNNLVEVVPSDLIGEYVGHTRNTIRRILDKAKGGVLFIDEAYNLNSAKDPDGGMYMREAVVELLKYMEDKSNVVVYAGYKLEMEELLNINPGFKSRIGNIINFEDYTTNELMDIFKLNAKKYDLNYTKDFLKELEKKIDKEKNNKNFGNARYIESLLNKILYVHANHVYDKGKDLYTLTKEDLNIKEENVNSFGFARKEG